VSFYSCLHTTVLSWFSQFVLSYIPLFNIRHGLIKYWISVFHTFQRKYIQRLVQNYYNYLVIYFLLGCNSFAPNPQYSTSVFRSLARLWYSSVQLLLFWLLICFRSLQEVVAALKPLFDMDIYLTRSIVASLNIYELVSIFNDNWIPIEVACATTLHWVKTTKASWNMWTQNFAYTEEEKVILHWQY